MRTVLWPPIREKYRDMQRGPQIIIANHTIGADVFNSPGKITAKNREFGIYPHRGHCQITSVLPANLK